MVAKGFPDFVASHLGLTTMALDSYNSGTVVSINE
jgi:hypothetical protein